jgi:hypothetical protein
VKDFALRALRSSSRSLSLLIWLVQFNREGDIDLRVQ